MPNFTGDSSNNLVNGGGGDDIVSGLNGDDTDVKLVGVLSGDVDGSWASA